MPKIQVTVDPVIHKKLKLIAKDQGRNVSELIRQYIAIAISEVKNSD
jgi:predicted HicB family RNase H-like nuclease